MDLYEFAPFGYLTIDRDGIVRQANRAAAALLQQDQPQLIGQPFSAFIDPTSQARWQQHQQAVFASDETSSCELTLRRGGGGVAYCRLESTVAPDRLRSAIGHDQPGMAQQQFRTALVDQTDLKQAEERIRRLNDQLQQRVAQRAEDLQRSQDRIRSLLDAAGDAIITIDQQGLIIDANPACQRMFGHPIETLLRKPISMLLPDAFGAADLKRFLSSLSDASQADSVRAIRQGVARRKDGELVPVELTVTEIDHQRMYLTIVRDITQRKELERQILDASSGEQRRIAQDLHDELGQELTGLRYMALNLVESLASTEGGLGEHDIAAALAQRIATGIATAQQHLRGAIRGIMPVDVDAEGLEAALRTLAERTNRYGKTICRVLCTNPVPLEDNAVATQLYRIAQEAVTNAIKHGHATQIGIRLELDAESVTLSVTDDGEGIDLASSFSAGWGLRIMQYRAGLIGAELKVEKIRPQGTMILCTLLTRR